MFTQILTARQAWRILLVICLLSTPSFASAMDGNGLLSECSDDEGSFSSGVCSGFVSGVAHVIGSNSINGYTACFPENVSYGQLRRVAVNHLEKHPDLLHYSASSLVAEAFATAFPC